MIQLTLGFVTAHPAVTGALIGPRTLEHLHAQLAAAGTGASLKDLMAHMGHSSVRAALIYQHATTEQQTEISNGISAAVVDIRTRRRRPSSAEGTPSTDMAGEA